MVGSNAWAAAPAVMPVLLPVVTVCMAQVGLTTFMFPAGMVLFVPPGPVMLFMVAVTDQPLRVPRASVMVMPLRAPVLTCVVPSRVILLMPTALPAWVMLMTPGSTARVTVWRTVQPTLLQESALKANDAKALSVVGASVSAAAMYFVAELPMANTPLTAPSALELVITGAPRGAKVASRAWMATAWLAS